MIVLVIIYYDFAFISFLKNTYELDELSTNFVQEDKKGIISMSHAPETHLITAPSYDHKNLQIPQREERKSRIHVAEMAQNRELRQ